MVVFHWGWHAGAQNHLIIYLYMNYTVLVLALALGSSGGIVIQDTSCTMYHYHNTNLLHCAIPHKICVALHHEMCIKDIFSPTPISD